MDPYNHEQVQAVWQRVLGQGDGQELRQSLEEMMAAEYASAAGYEKMSRQSPKHAGVLRAMAREERQHAHRLYTLYSLLWEKQPVIASAVARESAGFVQEVCRCYRGELGAAETYRNAAQKWKRHQQLFKALAADEQRHSENLYRIAGQFSKGSR